MIEDLKLTTDNLVRDGKLERKLRIRLRILEIISFVFGLITLYDIIFEGFYYFHVFLVVAISFLFGFLIMSKTSKVAWDKKRQVIVALKMDLIGVLILVAYIGFRIVFDFYLKDFWGGNLSRGFAYTFFIIFGVTLGRLLGMFVAVYKTEPNNHKRFRLFNRL